VFSTAADNQTSVEIHIVQGERPMAIDNKSLGKFVLDGIPPSPRGVPQVEVSFDIDANGILHVKATDKASNKEQKITITGTSGLTDEEVEKMRQEAEKYADEDKAKKEIIEIKNNSESLIYQTEKVLKDAGDKVTDDIKKPVEEKIATLKGLLEAENIDLEATKTAYEDLNQEIQKIGSAMYQNADTPGAEAEDDSVRVKNVDDENGPIEADAEVVDEDNSDADKK
jgi:molecular chaperone DnaK